MRAETKSVRTRLLLSIIAGTLVSTTLMLVFGVAGARDYRSLLSYRDALYANVTALEETQASLQARLTALGNSRELIELEARDLGYARPGARVLVVMDAPRARSALPVGSVVSRPQPAPTRRAAFVAAGTVIGALTFVALTLGRLRP